MTAATERLASNLAREIVVEEGFARELTEISGIVGRDGHQASAEGMLGLSRHHRIGGMEGRGNLAALREDIPPARGSREE